MGLSFFSTEGNEPVEERFEDSYDATADSPYIRILYPPSWIRESFQTAGLKLEHQNDVEDQDGDKAVLMLFRKLVDLENSAI